MNIWKLLKWNSKIVEVFVKVIYFFLVQKVVGKILFFFLG